jgi:phosphoribosylanthranilate isomerase
VRVEDGGGRAGEGTNEINRVKLLTPGRLFVKVCGLTRLEDAVVCGEAGVDAIGINFFPGSKRYHGIEEAREWLPEVPAGLLRIGLFVNASIGEIERVAGSGLLEGIQLHGDEPVVFTEAVQQIGLPVLRAVALREERDLERIAVDPAEAFILDAFAPGVYGGTGHRCDWPLAARAVREFPEKVLILAGGLTPENAGEAVRAVRPAGVDTASGVEVRPGVKDGGMIWGFAGAARAKPDYSDME